MKPIKLLVILLYFVLAQNIATVAALSSEQLKAFDSNINYFDTAVCSDTSSASSSSAADTESGGGVVVWPFATKSTDQYQRVDQGWDVQDKPGANVYAIASGTLHVYQPDPGGFGNDYPVEELDSSIGGPSQWVYYGHVHILPAVNGQHVNAGQLIANANTSDPQNGSAAPAGWLEIGFAQPGTDAPLQRGSETTATQAGQDMKDILLKVQAAPGSTSAPTAGGSGSAATSCCSSSGSTTSSAPTTAVSGTISPNVGNGMSSTAQQKFQQIIVAASSKYNVPPNFIAAFYYAENAPTGDSTNNGDSSKPPPQTGDGKWREPAPPYGTGAKYPPPNQYSATGPFQFITSTWDSYGVNASGHPGPPDVNDLTDAAFGAAHYMSASGAKVGASDATLTTAALAYNHSSTYAQSVLNTYHYMTSKGQTSVSGSVASGGCGSTGSSASPSCASASGNAKILCEAQQYQDIYYLLDGGHGYAKFRQQCPESSISGAAASSTASNPGPCATDCSGLVSVAIDAVFSQNFDWTVGGIEQDSKNWKQLPVKSVQAGDVVTLGSDTHVEIVDHYDSSSGRLYTFGSHSTGEKTSSITSPPSYWTGAYRYIGPGSSGS